MSQALLSALEKMKGNSLVCRKHLNHCTDTFKSVETCTEISIILCTVDSSTSNGASKVQPRRMPAKMKSKLKLKSRKKSEATPEFLKKTVINDVSDSEQTSSQDSPDNCNNDEDTICHQIRRNILELSNAHEE